MARWGDDGARFDIDGLLTAHPDTPVVGLNDSRDFGRDHLVMMSDEERESLAWLVDRAQRDKEVSMVRSGRRRWYERTMGMAALALGIILTILNIVALILVLVHIGG